MSGMTSGLQSSFQNVSKLISGLGLDRLAREAVSMGMDYKIAMDNARAAVVGLTDSQQEADDLMHRMTEFAIQTPFDLPGVQDATTRMMAFGKSFGVTSENVIDYIQIIGDAAASTGKGTDAMNNVITTLGKISGQGRVMTRDMNQLTANFPSLHPWEVLADVTGKSVEELRALAIKPGGLSSIVDANEYVTALMGAMEKMPGAAGAMDRKMATLGGTIEMFKDTMGVALAEGLNPLWEAMGTLMRDPAIQASIESLIAVFGELVGEIAQGLVPVMPQLISAFQMILESVMPIIPSIAQLAEIFAMALVTLAPLIETVAMFVSWMMDLIMTLDPGILSGIAAALLALWVVGFGPIGAIVIGVIALATIIRQNWDEIVASTEGMVDAVVAAWDWLYEHIIGPVVEFVKGIIEWFQNLYDELVGNSIIPDLVNAIVEWFQKLWDWIVNIVTGIVNWVKNHWQLLISIMLGPLGVILALVITHWDSIKEFISTTINAILSAVRTVFGAVSSFLSSVWNGIKSVAQTVWNAIKSAIIDPISDARDKAKEAVQNILDKVRSAWSGLVGFVSGVWDGVKSAITGPIQAAYNFVADKVAAIKRLVQGAIDKVQSIPGAGVVGDVIGWLHAEGGVFNRPHVGIVAERGPEAIIPMSNPMRAMQVMHEAGLDRLMAQMGQQRGFTGPLISMPGAVIQDATDADLVAQRTLVAMQAAMVA